MFRTVELPLWLFVLILLFAAITFASHFLFPSVRWFFRRRAERLVARLNTRLRRPIEPFKLARRHDMIQRLIYDPLVTEAIVEYARAEGVPENVAFEKARDYAREIVPAFSATAYFTIGTRLARWLSRALYRIRLGAFDRDALDRIDPDAAVIFVMNHRSNMDYVLVTWLVSRTSALSYAVGEWARVWPLSVMIRAMGAYFIRRRSRGALYRRVLARYVQMATAGGVTQAIFPEGGLSLDGAVHPPKLGLLSYILDGFDGAGRDVIFVPVGLNYDRVLEDRILTDAAKAGSRRFRPPIWQTIKGVGRYVFRFLTGRFRPYGTASVGFGTPLSLRDFLARSAEQDADAVGRELMDRVSRVIPVLPVPLLSWLILNRPAMEAEAMEGAVAEVLTALSSKGMALPRRSPKLIVEDAVRTLRHRALIAPNGPLVPTEEGETILAFYARSIAHHLPSSPEQVQKTGE